MLVGLVGLVGLLSTRWEKNNNEEMKRNEPTKNPTNPTNPTRGVNSCCLTPGLQVTVTHQGCLLPSEDCNLYIEFGTAQSVYDSLPNPYGCFPQNPLQSY